MRFKYKHYFINNTAQQIKVKNYGLDIYLWDHERVHYKQWKQNRCHVFSHFTGATGVLRQLNKIKNIFRHLKPKKKTQFDLYSWGLGVYD